MCSPRLLLLCGVLFSGGCLAFRVAVVGAGIAGSSTAYFLREEFGEEVEIELFEKGSTVGGRVQSKVYEGVRVELGASMFIDKNYNMMNYTKHFGLEVYRPFRSDRPSLVGVWDGHSFVFEESNYAVFSAVKAISRYGLAPVSSKDIVKTTVDKFLRIYQDSFAESPFEDVEQLARNLDLIEQLQTTATDYLNANLNSLFVDELIGGITRNTYGTHSSEIHALAALVSLAGSGDNVFAVREGNTGLVDAFVGHSKASTRLKSRIEKITTKNGKFQLHSSSPSSESSGVFDYVIAACPQVPPVDDRVFESVPYREVHTSVVVGVLRNSYFGVSESSSLPSDILTTNNADIPFSSLSVLGFSPSGNAVCKLFSSSRLEDQLLDQIFSKVEFVDRHHWLAYPQMTPENALKQHKIEVTKNVYHVNSLEPMVSTMETEIVAARNVVRLLRLRRRPTRRQEL